MAYRDPLPSDPFYESSFALDVLGPERAAFWRQRHEDDGSPRFVNYATAVLRAELDVALFAKVDRLQASIERLADAINRK